MYSASIIIPVYNSLSTLEKSVESLLFGSFRNIKVILIDDCSTDGSWPLCETLSDKYENVICVQNKTNSGVSFTRNQGLLLAEGEYVLFVDSDDWVSGRYVEELIEAAVNYPDTLPICGLHFYDEVANYKRDYVWQNDGAKFCSVDISNIFELADRFQLQQVWNKIFRREIIEQNSIRFDESQHMGEDHQFVLDYLERGGITTCMVLNEPLYYYIRANSSSLMSEFGLTTNFDNNDKRLRQMLKLAGENDLEHIMQYQTALCNARTTSTYHIIHNKQWSNKQKFELVQTIVGDKQGKAFYYKQKSILIKEKLNSSLKWVKQIPSRIKGKFLRSNNTRIIANMRRKMKNDYFSILSQNCIGGVFYHDMGLKFTTPTVNLYFTCPDFVKFVLNLDYYLNKDIEMTWGEEYPIGYIDDIRVYFQHYKSCTEAKKKWEERKGRINKENLVILCTDMETFDDETYSRWKKIPYPKLLFTSLPLSDQDVLYFPQYRENGHIGDLIPKREFYKDKRLIDVVNRVG